METKTELRDGIIIETTYDDNGVMLYQKFRTEERQKETKQERKTKIMRFFSWLGEHLYLKRRDLADPFGERDDVDRGKDGKTGIEIGLKWKF